MTLAELESLLDAYGGDRARWPADRRAAGEALIKDDVAARRLLDEARALDRVLAHAPLPETASLKGIEDRIVAAALAERLAGGHAVDRGLMPPEARKASTVIGLPHRARTGQATAPHPQLARRPSRWQPAAALAASLALGVVVGLADLAPTSALSLTSITYTSSDAEMVLASLAIDGLAGALDEDQP
jgi:hypothetical protein